MGIIGDIFGFIATPLYYAISGILIGWHKLFDAASVWTPPAACRGCCRSSV